MLIKRTEREARRGTLAAALAGQSGGTLDRRGFLRRSGLIAGGPHLRTELLSLLEPHLHPATPQPGE